MEVYDDFQDVEEFHPNSVPKQYLPFSCSELSEEHIKYAEERLNETEENRKNGLIRIKKFLKDESIVFSDLEDIYLLNFLRVSWFNFKKTCQLMKRDLEFIENYRYYINRIDTALLTRVISSKVISFLPYRDARGCAILLLKAENWDPNELSAEDVVFGGMVAVHTCLANPLNQVAGYVVIVDFKNASFKQFTKCKNWLMVVIQSLQNVCPANIREIHFIHVAKVVVWSWSLVKSFLKERVKRKIIFYDASNWEGLHSRISPCILPEEYGGQLGPYSYNHWASDPPAIKKNFFELFHQILKEQKTN